MRSTKLAALLFLMTAITFEGCKDKATKELIINKWKFTGISGPDAEKIPDSLKKKLYETASMEFKKDGSYEQSGGMQEGIKKGTYSISDDGKSIYSKKDGSNETDTVMILQISKDKMVISPKSNGDGGNMQATMIPK